MKHTEKINAKINDKELWVQYTAEENPISFLLGLQITFLFFFFFLSPSLVGEYTKLCLIIRDTAKRQKIDIIYRFSRIIALLSISSCHFLKENHQRSVRLGLIYGKFSL